MKALLAGLGAVLVVFGLVVGLVPHSVERVAAPSLDCGSPWRPATGVPGTTATGTLDVYVDAAARCAAENDVLGSLAAYVAAGGALLLVGAGAARVLRRGPARVGAGVPEPRGAEAEPIEPVEFVELSPYDATPVAREPIG